MRVIYNMKAPGLVKAKRDPVTGRATAEHVLLRPGVNDLTDEQLDVLTSSSQFEAMVARGEIDVAQEVSRAVIRKDAAPPREDPEAMVDTVRLGVIQREPELEQEPEPEPTPGLELDPELDEGMPADLPAWSTDMKVDELREALIARGGDPTGKKKAELISELEFLDA